VASSPKQELKAPVPVSPAGATAAKKPKAEPTPRISSIGVGGDNDTSFTFKIGALTEQSFIKGVPALDPLRTAKMELAPARRSFYEKGGMQPPGAGAGLEVRTRFNITKLNVPASRPIYQHFGIAEETLEWVGAFIGTDVEIGDSAGIRDEGPWRNNLNTDAWDQVEVLTRIVREGRPLGIEIRWVTGPISNLLKHEIGLEPQNKKVNSVMFTGYIKEFVKSFATQQRVYYRVLFVITNRQDINQFKQTARQIELPEKIGEGFSESDIRQIEKDMQEKRKNGGYSVDTFKDLGKTLENETKVNQFVDNIKTLPVNKKQELKEALKTAGSRANILGSATREETIKSAADNKKEDRLIPFTKNDPEKALSTLAEVIENYGQDLPPEIYQSREAIKTYQAEYNYAKTAKSNHKEAAPPKPVPPKETPKPQPTPTETLDNMEYDPVTGRTVEKPQPK
jgi:hypothetical protein